MVSADCINRYTLRDYEVRRRHTLDFFFVHILNNVPAQMTSMDDFTKSSMMVHCLKSVKKIILSHAHMQHPALIIHKTCMQSVMA